ncbi:hypothetical protein DL96DRAFT_261192 [Flagelloscypha sp. PMI_526]|nr:hypothetical protein DL96DRAFT_261192 [Flagelloscypha sp. PMI_526]
MHPPHSYITPESSEELPTTSTLRAKDSPSSLASMFSRGRRTRIHHNVSTKPLARLYTEELYKAGHGLPLWDPQPLFKGKPVEIGDVGLITEDGGFEILFNATVPAEEQEQYRLPPNFSPLMINHMDIQVSPEVTSAPYIVCGDVKLQERDFPEATGTDVKDAHEFEFAFSAMKGAALVLSNSPVRLSVRPSHRIRSYIEKYAESWYYFLEKDTSGPQLILNGQSLVFVTGVCRNSKWAVGAWDNNNVRSEVSYFGSATVSDDNTLTLSGNWESPGHDTKQGPSSARGDPLPRLRPQDSSDLSEHLAAPSQCLFVRGFTIAAKHVQEVDPHNVFPQPSWIQNAWKSLRLGIPPILRAAAEPHDPPPPPPPPSSPAVPSRGTSPGPNSVIQDIPTQRPPQHPSRGLTDLIFNFLPAARFAVVHDDDVYGTMTGTHPCQMMLDANNVVSLSFPESTTPEDCPAERGDLASTMPPAQPFRYDSDARERHHITEVSQPIPPIQFPTRNTTRHESSNRLPQIFTPLVVDYTDIQVSSAVTSAPYIARGDMKPQERGFLDGTRAGKKDAQELDLTSSATRGATVALSDPPIRLRVRPSHRIHSNIEKNTESRYVLSELA